MQLYTRSVTFGSHRREDDLWDIEAELVDVKGLPI